MNELVLASANKKKIKELNELLVGFKVLSLQDIGFDQEIAEPFFSFSENAFTKANTIYSFCKKNVLADDSGICVSALNDAPGVFSARYAGLNANDETNLNKLIEDMQGQSDRRAYYKAVLCLIWEGQAHYFEGECHGHLLSEKKGENGFGYDPIFVPDGYNETFAELSPSIKQSISHRAIAMQKMIAFITQKTQS